MNCLTFTEMAEDGEIDVMGDFDLKLQADSEIYDANELPSKSANLLPEYTHPPWMLEQGWTLDNCMDEKSKATIEKMLMEEQYYLGGKPTRSKPRRSLVVKDHLAYSPGVGGRAGPSKLQGRAVLKRAWTDAEKQMLIRGMEIYGKSWTKIAELIPSRTTLQIKSYAHQNLKLKEQKVTETITSTATESNTEPKPSPEPAVATSGPANPIIETITRVTTAQPTVTIRQVILPKKGRIPKVNKPTVKPAKQKSPAKNSKSPKYKQKKKANISVTVKHMQLHHGGERTGDVTKFTKYSSMNKIKSAANRVPVNFLQQKMSSSPALIENLDGFCAVSDIMSSSTDEGVDEDIDIENDDDSNDNLILQNRSTSPNSIYEKLVLEANLETMKKETHSVFQNSHSSEKGVNDGIQNELVNERGNDMDVVVANEDDDCVEDVEEKDLEKPPIASPEKTESKESLEEKIEKVEAETKAESTKEDTPEQKLLVNAVVTCDGEVVHYPVPHEETIPDPSLVSEEEKQVNADFFENNRSSTKTPERYLKIRNYIIETWKKCRPNYLNKTSVRPGLKNCGDVNCIGRVHSFLECIGAINFGCDQACYRQPRHIFPPIREKATKGDVQSDQVSAKKESMRPRKRKVKDAFGVWVDEKDLQGKTIEHPVEAVDPKPAKQPTIKQTGYDPFKLVPCLSFTAENPAPFQVKIHNAALIVMDIHSHISKTEVIGMLGGRYCLDQGRLTVTMATPCNSISTGMQCEMDPVSQTQASEEIRGAGMDVVGWYHSHPTFAPNPSVRDIETQLKFQDWFSKGGSKFVGIIISPYNRTGPGLGSEVNCLTVSEEVLPHVHCNIPYKFEVSMRPCDAGEVNQLILTAQDLATSYSTYPNRVDLSSIYTMAGCLTCLQKMLESIKLRYELPDTHGLLTSIRKAFTNSDIELDRKSLSQISESSKDSPISENTSENS